MRKLSEIRKALQRVEQARKALEAIRQCESVHPSGLRCELVDGHDELSGTMHAARPAPLQPRVEW